MNERKYELMEKYLKGDYTVNDLIECIVELEEKVFLNKVKDAYSIKECVLESRSDAEKVLEKLLEYGDKYENVSVADYYDLIGMPCMYVDNGYGWTHGSIEKAKVIPYSNGYKPPISYSNHFNNSNRGYVIKFPPVEVL
jgi:hypothetical protein